MAHTKDQRGCEIIVGNKSHILLWEQSGASQVGTYTYVRKRLKQKLYI